MPGSRVQGVRTCAAAPAPAVARSGCLPPVAARLLLLLLHLLRLLVPSWLVATFYHHITTHHHYAPPLPLSLETIMPGRITGEGLKQRWLQLQGALAAAERCGLDCIDQT